MLLFHNGGYSASPLPEKHPVSQKIIFFPGFRAFIFGKLQCPLKSALHKVPFGSRPLSSLGSKHTAAVPGIAEI